MLDSKPQIPEFFRSNQVKSMSLEKNPSAIEYVNGIGELFTYQWRIDNLRDCKSSSATFYKTIKLSTDILVHIKMKRSPLQILYLPDYLHDGKIRIRDFRLEATVWCTSPVNKMLECSMILYSDVEDMSDSDVVVNNIFGESAEQPTKDNEHIVSYKHTDIMTYKCLKPNDLLAVVCEIQILFSSEDIVVHANPRINFGRLFENNQFADYIFTVKGVDFHVHKVILALSSPVFEDIFENDLLADKKGNRNVIEDFDPEVFKEVLRFIYTGEIENFYDNGLEIIKMADKYQIKGLKTVCEQRICADLLNLPVENSMILLELADLYRCEWLKKRTIEFIVSRISSIVDTEAWKEFILKNPKLTNEIRDAMTKAEIPVSF